jgi:hypothetical protein
MGRGAAPTAEQRVIANELRAAQRGHQSEQHDGKDGHGAGEREHADVDVNFLEPRQPWRRGDDTVEQPSRDEQARGESYAREQRAFGQQLRHQAAAGCAERLPNGELALAPRAAGQQHAGEIGARHEEHKPRGAEEYPDRPPHGPNQLLPQRRDPNADRIGVAAVLVL